MRKSIAQLSFTSSIACYASTFETEFDYFHVINDNAMFNTVRSVRSWMLCDCDLRDMNLLPIVSVATERPIGTPCALGEHEMDFFRRWTVFAALKCLETIWNEKRKRRHRSRSRSWESCLHYLIRQLVCEQIPAIEHTITFLSSHSRPLTHFSFSAASSMLLNQLIVCLISAKRNTNS